MNNQIDYDKINERFERILKRVKPSRARKILEIIQNNPDLIEHTKIGQGTVEFDPNYEYSGLGFKGELEETNWYQGILAKKIKIAKGYSGKGAEDIDETYDYAGYGAGHVGKAFDCSAIYANEIDEAYDRAGIEAILIRHAYGTDSGFRAHSIERVTSCYGRWDWF